MKADNALVRILVIGGVVATIAAALVLFWKVVVGLTLLFCVVVLGARVL